MQGHAQYSMIALKQAMTAGHSFQNAPEHAKSLWSDVLKAALEASDNFRRAV